MDSEKSNRALGFLALITRPSLTGLSTRSFVPLGRRRVRHHSSLGTTSRGQQTHHHHLQGPPQLIYKSWSVAYDTWPTSRRPTTQASTSRYWAHDRQIVITRPAQDVKEALLGGNLELAAKKLPATRSRKGTIEEGSNATPQSDTGFDKH